MTAREATMPAAALHQPPSAMPQNDPDTTVQTRFGPLPCNEQALVEMPQGPLGFAEHRRFALLDIPNPRLARFRLLQSLADPDLSFVVLPMSGEDGLIAPPDVEEACAALGIAPADVLLLLIVTVRPAPSGATMTVNLRAPLALDVGQRVARQVVLSSPAYSIRHPL